jgi:hypothetical protein
MKHIRIRTNHNNLYQVSVREVAEIRADYYACEVDGEEKGSEHWKKEVRFAVNNPLEAKSYFMNSMRFEDMKELDSFERLPPPDLGPEEPESFFLQ